MTSFLGSLQLALNKYYKYTSDIEYVSYCIGLDRRNRDCYYCSYDEFARAIPDDVDLSKIQWLEDVKFVGDIWWMHFDVIQYTWVFHNIPIKPRRHHPPRSDEITDAFYI